MDSFALTPGNNQDHSQRETAEHLWKMLDELALSDRESYNSFIRKTLSDVPASLRSKSTAAVSAWKLFQVPCAHLNAKFLLFKFYSNASLPIDSETQLPVKSSWKPSLEADNLSVAIEISSKLILELEKEGEALAELIMLACEQVHKVSGIRSQPESFQQYQGKSECDSQSVGIERTHDGIKLPHFLFDKFSSENIQPKPHGNRKILIEELSSSSVSGNLTVPEFHFEVQKTFIQYQIELPMLESLSDYDLTLENDSLSLSIPKFYEFRHKHNLSVNSDLATAKFLRKPKILKIVLPLV